VGQKQGVLGQKQSLLGQKRGLVGTIDPTKGSAQQA
jgi:hypothetical protein